MTYIYLYYNNINYIIKNYMGPNFITTVEENEKVKTIDNLCSFVELVEKRQNYLYWWNTENITEKDFLETETILENFSNNIRLYVIWIITKDEKIAYLKNMQISTIIMWIEFYRQPRFLRNFSENINRLLWYNGK